MARARSEEKEKALLRAATELFVQQGVAQTTVKEIADRAGVAVGTVYRYYEDKVALVRGVAFSFAEIHEIMATRIIESDQDPFEKLRAYILELYDLWQPFGANTDAAVELAYAVIKYAGETLEIAQQCFGSTIETLLVEARSAGLSVGDPHADSKWISIATSPFFPLAGTAPEKPFAFNLDRDCLKGLLDWIVDRLAS
ncbi:MAG: TetR/AcrR family transcriptional regulator [Opitutaceae bacterium]